MIISCNETVVADKLTIADSFLSRLKGLMGRTNLDEGEALLLLNCAGIHCFFMRMTIDAVYLSEDMAVLDIETLPPWRIGKQVKNAAHVLEVSAGSARVSKGDKLCIHRTKDEE
ncbi:MAG: DUF192 domain-containing protein [Oscillospiraceae bacterium]